MPHEWIKITLGRVCLACSLAQADGEFDDGANRPCPKDVPYVPPKSATSRRAVEASREPQVPGEAAAG
jgi:hypothetical protein